MPRPATSEFMIRSRCAWAWACAEPANSRWTPGGSFNFLFSVSSASPTNELTVASDDVGGHGLQALSAEVVGPDSARPSGTRRRLLQQHEVAGARAQGKIADVGDVLAAFLVEDGDDVEDAAAFVGLPDMSPW